MTKEVFKKLAELNVARNKLDDELKEVYKQIIEIKRSVDRNIIGLCFRNENFYYKIIGESSLDIDYVICYLHKGYPYNSYMNIEYGVDKLEFLEREYEIITREEFDKALEKVYNELNRIYE